MSINYTFYLTGRMSVNFEICVTVTPNAGSGTPC